MGVGMLHLLAACFDLGTTTSMPAADPTQIDPPPVFSATAEPVGAVRAGQRLFPWRIVVGIAGLVLGVCVIRPRGLFGEHQTAGTLVSLLLVIAGLSLRAWAAACAGGHTRSDEIEAPQLVTAGPFAFVRNPIYLGSLVLGLGMIGLLGDPWLLVPHALVFMVFFGMIVPAEEQFLARQFGEEYSRYCRNVRRLAPSLRPWAGAIARPLRWEAARGEAVIAGALVVIYGAFHAVLYFHGSPR